MEGSRGRVRERGRVKGAQGAEKSCSPGLVLRTKAGEVGSLRMPAGATLRPRPFQHGFQQSCSAALVYPRGSQSRMAQKRQRDAVHGWHTDLLLVPLQVCRLNVRRMMFEVERKQEPQTCECLPSNGGACLGNRKCPYENSVRESFTAALILRFHINVHILICPQQVRLYISCGSGS